MCKSSKYWLKENIWQYNSSYPWAVKLQATFIHFMCFPGDSAGKESACNAGDPGSIPGSGSSPGEGKGYPLQCSGLENPMESDTTERLYLFYTFYIMKILFFLRKKFKHYLFWNNGFLHTIVYQKWALALLTVLQFLITLKSPRCIHLCKCLPYLPF